MHENRKEAKHEIKYMVNNDAANTKNRSNYSNNLIFYNLEDNF